MHIVACIELNVVALAMCLMICFHDRPKDGSDLFGYTHFNRLIAMTIIILVLNIVAWIIEGCCPDSGAAFHMTTMTLYYFAQALLSMELLKYCISVCGFHTPNFIKLVCTMPTVFTTGVLIANSIKPFAYHMTQHNSYQRLPLFPLVIIGPLVYLIGSACVCIIRFFRSASYERDLYRKLLLFTLTILASGVLSAVIYGFTPWPIIALALVFMHLNIHSRQNRELGMLAYKDTLTGVHNATAHSFSMKKLDSGIQSGDAAFAIVVADINDLKLVNDCYGHDAGDRLLVKAARLICDTFAHSPVHRIGGDEFSIILEGSDYENRDLLIRRLIREMPYATYNAGKRELSVSMAVGMAEYNPDKHGRSADVFQSADRAMYTNKNRLKKGSW